jgi:hypothetical protein
MPGKKPCPNPSCGELIHDWHTEWLVKQHRVLVFNGKAATDCPVCRSPILIPGEVVLGLAPDTVPLLRRSRSQADKWAYWSAGSASVDAYLETLEGSQYAGYHFEA